MTAVLAPPHRSTVVFDEVAAARHRSEFARLLEDPELRGRVIADVVERRARFAADSGASSTRVAVEELEGLDGDRALIAHGEVLVSNASAEVIRRLSRDGFACVGRAGTVLRFQNRNSDAAMVRAACDELLWRGAKVSPNYVVYAGGFVKARLGLLEPLPTKTRPVVSPTSDRTAAGVRVAVLDTASDGVNGGAPSHGSFVAGLVRQVAPGSELEMRTALAADGLGTDFSVAQELLRLAAETPAVPVVNLSLYCMPVDGLVPVAIADALDAFTSRHPETVVVAAAGNAGSPCPSWPAAHPSVVAVGAVDGRRPAAFSSQGPWVDFSTRADGVVSNHVAWSGTSFAAAQVSGALAGMTGKGLSRAEALGEFTLSGVTTERCGVAVEPGSLT